MGNGIKMKKFAEFIKEWKLEILISVVWLCVVVNVFNNNWNDVWFAVSTVIVCVLLEILGELYRANKRLLSIKSSLELNRKQMIYSGKLIQRDILIKLSEDDQDENSDS